MREKEIVDATDKIAETTEKLVTDENEKQLADITLAPIIYFTHAFAIKNPDFLPHTDILLRDNRLTSDGSNRQSILGAELDSLYSNHSRSRHYEDEIANKYKEYVDFWTDFNKTFVASEACRSPIDYCTTYINYVDNRLALLNRFLNERFSEQAIGSIVKMLGECYLSISNISMFTTCIQKLDEEKNVSLFVGMSHIPNIIHLIKQHNGFNDSHDSYYNGSSLSDEDMQIQMNTFKNNRANEEDLDEFFKLNPSIQDIEDIMIHIILGTCSLRDNTTPTVIGHIYDFIVKHNIKDKINWFRLILNSRSECMINWLVNDERGPKIVINETMMKLSREKKYFTSR